MTETFTRWAAIATIGAALFATGWLQGAHREQVKAASFEAATEALGKAQAERAKETNRRQLANLERINDGLKKSNRAAAENAVRNYVARNPRWLLRNDPGRGSLSKLAPGEPGNDGASGKCLAAEPDREFIETCARDAGRLGVWQRWATGNSIPVR